MGTTETTAAATTDPTRASTITDTVSSTPSSFGQRSCDDGWTPLHVTRSLLGWGVVAGPFYVTVSLVQALTRDGFDLTRHQWSLLENGALGWVQVTNFVLVGAMLIAFAVGLHRALVTGPGSRWAPILVGVFGASQVAAGIFTADPALGFPAGTPAGPGTITVHGLLHFAGGGVGFLAIAAACFVVARRQRADTRRVAAAAVSRLTALVFLGGFLCVASGGGSVAANLAFTATVILVFAWVSVTAAHLYRSVAPPAPASH